MALFFVSFIYRRYIFMNYTGVNFQSVNYQNMMLCSIDKEKINQVGAGGQQIKEVGVTIDEYNRVCEELKRAIGTLEDYRKKLIEAGILKKEKTPQEMYEEQMATMKQIMQEMKELKQWKAENEHKLSNTDNTESDSETKTTSV